MTTIACNLKEIAADTRCTWDGVGSDAYTTVKLYVTDRAVYGVTGSDCTGSITAIEWLQSNRGTDFKPMPPEYDHSWDWKLIELSNFGISVYNERLEKDPMLEPMMAVGSGRKVALYCMKYLGMSPAEAVMEACKVDDHSDAPVYMARLSDLQVKRWTPTKKAPKRKP